MPSDINELSKMLGTMQSDISHIKKLAESTNDRVREVSEKTIRAEVSVLGAHKRLDKVEPAVEDYKRQKSRIIGVIAGSSFASGGLGAALFKLFGGH